MSAAAARTRCAAIAVLLFACTSAAGAEKFTGFVTRVIDGDTLIVRYLEQHISVQLEGVDAPRGAEPYAKQSGQSLARLCSRRTARVVSEHSDAWGRVLGEVFCNGVNVNEEQLRQGLGKLQDPDHAPDGWRELQAEAQAAARGIWSRSAVH